MNEYEKGQASIWNQIFVKGKVYNCFYTRFPHEVVPCLGRFVEAIGDCLYMKPIIRGDEWDGSVPYCAKDIFDLNFEPKAVEK